MSILCPFPTSPAAPPPMEDDDLLSEILLRLPPQPSSLPRASAACKRWRCLVSDPAFTRRFRRHHHTRNPPPLLGFFSQDAAGITFNPTMEPPDRVSPSRFTVLLEARFHSKLLGCRHGLVLMFHQKLKQVMVWDPVTGDQRSIAVPHPLVFGTDKTPRGAVLRAAGDAHHFRVVLASCDRHDRQHTRAFACIYSSETGEWSDLISTLLPSEEYRTLSSMPAVLTGDSLYWTITGNWRAVLEFDLNRLSLAVIHLPMDKFANCNPWNIMVMPTEGGGLGLLFMSGLTAQLWKRNIDCDGVASWVLGRTVELDKLLSLNSKKEKLFLMITGFAESNNVVFLRSVVGLFMVQLDSLQFKKVSEIRAGYWYHPFESIYAAGI
ncbi:uncharacterized protein LOC124689576 [Lolium rigidum]|uniref:uncharacterized protein LOC124689576 n=1 Tax=Lolium rigidum TaxID=89674 RepID=UPI001F5C8AAB|nr:uncharacterized protein LOC124689576 [Lolium rigidum]